MPKAPSRSSAAARRHNPLADDILSAGQLRTQSNRKSNRRSRTAEENEGDDREQFVEAKLSRKILQIGQELAEEDAIELGNSDDVGEKQNPAFGFDSRFEDEENISEDEDNAADDQWGDEEVEDVVSFFFFFFPLNHRGEFLV